MMKRDQGYSVDYDDLTDTLYLSVGTPLPATDSYLDEHYVWVREVDGRVSGLTIEGFKDRHEDGSWTDALILQYLPHFDPSFLAEIVEAAPITA